MEVKVMQWNVLADGLAQSGEFLVRERVLLCHAAQLRRPVTRRDGCVFVTCRSIQRF
jgi:hypothetical protein